jgi:hypothetical protein
LKIIIGEWEILFTQGFIPRHQSPASHAGLLFTGGPGGISKPMELLLFQRPAFRPSVNLALRRRIPASGGVSQALKYSHNCINFLTNI